MINTLEGKVCNNCKWLKNYNYYFNLVTCKNSNSVFRIDKTLKDRVTFVLVKGFKCPYREEDFTKGLYGGGG